MNLAGVLLATADSAPERLALLGPERVTYGQLAGMAASVAAEVARHAGAADRVAIVAGNETPFVAAYLGTLLAGAVAVPLNVGSPSHEVARELDVVAPVLVLASAAYADLARRAVGQLTTRRGDSSEDSPRPSASEFGTAGDSSEDSPRATGESTPAGDSSGESSQRGITVVVVDDLVAAPAGGAAAPAPAPAPKESSDLAVLLFTAGTAGAPRPAMLTHGSLLANIEQMQSHPGLRVTQSDVALGVLPLFHVYGLNVVVGLALQAGGSVSLIDHFHPVETLARVRADGVTVVAGVPAIFDAWLGLDDAAAPANAFASVRLCVSGASTLGAQTASAMQERFGVVVHDGYGLTEASPVVTTTAVETGRRPGSIGPPLPGVEVRLVGDDGHAALEGDPGEIVVRGANVFAGYWNDPDATGAVLVDGWLHTGDIAVAGPDGWLTLVDRAKDVVIVSGFNVFPGEVEDALRSHRDVADVAVIGEPHPRTGETVVAFVVPRPGSTPDPVELLRHAGRQLARYKLPTRVEVVDSLPRSFAGKLLRRSLSSAPAAGRGLDDATTKPA